MAKKDYLFTAILFILLVGIFYNMGPGRDELVIFTTLATLLVVSLFFIKKYYSKGESSLKQHFLQLCMAFVVITAFYLATKALIGFSLNYSMIVMLFVALLISTLWENLTLSILEKGVLAVTIITIIGGITYETIASRPTTAIQFYNTKIRDVESYEGFRDLLPEDYRYDFTEEDFKEIEPYLEESTLRFHQPAIIEFKDGQTAILEVDLARNEWNKPLRLTKFEILPEEVAAYFRYYPLGIERQANFPQGEEEDDTIIEVRGAFVSHGSHHQKQDWYNRLIGVFGEQEVWDELWQDLNGVLSPVNPVRGSGTNSKGYIEIRLSKDWKIDESVLDQIYKQFQNKAAEDGIENLPMVFKWHIR